MNVTTAKHLVAKEKPSMSNVTTDAEKTPAAAAQPSEPEAKPKKATKGAKPAKKAKATKPAKSAKKVKPTKKAAGKPAAERSNKKADVIAMMKRAKGATLPEIMETTGWQKHTVRGFVSLLGSKGGEKIESSKNAAGERTYRIAHAK
jgi:FtsZ-interacting cell division protein ZipA